MSGFNTAAATIKSWAIRYKELLDLAALLEQVGSLDNVVNEQNARAQAARSNAELEEKRFLDIQARSKGVMSDAEREAQQVVADAQAKAQGLVNDAQAKASGLVESAKAHKADIDALASQREAQANDAQARVAAATKELDVLTQRIAAAKAQIAKLLGV
jgi:cell division septum initiation protein DivIVA